MGSSNVRHNTSNAEGFPVRVVGEQRRLGLGADAQQHTLVGRGADDGQVEVIEKQPGRRLPAVEGQQQRVHILDGFLISGHTSRLCQAAVSNHARYDWLS